MKDNPYLYATVNNAIIWGCASAAIGIACAKLKNARPLVALIFPMLATVTVSQPRPASTPVKV